ncbi:MAG: tetratricopeptide repeat protein [Hyphomicrobiales bacterium]
MPKLAERTAAASAHPKDVREHPLFRAREAVRESERLRLAGQLDRARDVCAPVLAQFPDYVGALQTMGLILADKAAYDQALTHLQRASMFNPRDPRILTALSGVYLRLGSPLSAIRALEHALQISPDDAAIHATLGEIYREEKEYEHSKNAFETALALDPQFTAAEIGLVQTLTHIGQLGEAAAILERRIRDGSRSTGLLYMLSQLPPALVSVDLLSLLAETKLPTDKQDSRVQLAFAKAAAFDRAGMYDEAWSHLREARQHRADENREIYQQSRQRYPILLDAIRRNRTSPEADGPGDVPVSLFIAGPSRSGKTTMERLVGTLAGVKRGYENPIVENAVRFAFQTAGFPTRSSPLELPPDTRDLFRQGYVDELRKRAGSAQVLTNTVPARGEDAWKAATFIPRARYIFVKRDIDDTTLRIYMRNYKSGNHYAGDLRDIRDYIHWMHQIMDLTAEMMPDTCRVLTYEEIVADPKGARSIAAQLCGLEPGDEPVPEIGDDRGCAAPYLEHMRAALASA